MPHRPEGASTSSAAAASAYSSHLSTMRGEAAAHIMRPTGVYRTAGVVTPLASKQWLASHESLSGMVAILGTPKSSDSADRSIGTKHDEDTVATLATEATPEELEKREATATALLMVSAQSTKHVFSNRDSFRSSDTQQTSMPLKKRKKHLDFLRRNQEIVPDSSKQTDPCHVSPVSHSSVGSIHATAVSSEEVTPGRRMIDGANSYDSKESPYKKESTQTLLDSSKIHSTTDIGPPAHVVMPHFPTVLHQALSDPDFSGTVLQWLSDGETWKVLRWDALRRQVLPRYFPDLRDENGIGAGTIDAFLWHLTAWGFDEMKDGTDVGAYQHDLFIRGAQKLSSKMRFTAVPSNEESKVPKTVTPQRVRMLQVPSLASVSRSDAESVSSKPKSPNKRARYEGQSSVETPRRSPLNWPMAYRSDDPYAESAAWGQYYSDHHGMRPMAGQYVTSAYDPRFHIHHVGAESVMRQPSQYSPPQVRSGRGALRISTSNRVGSSPTSTQAVRSSFPVSNRGKGRKLGVCRTAIRAAEVGKHGNALVETPVSLHEAQRIGDSVQGVAVAVSRKTKRKLPLARNVGEASDAKNWN